MPISIGWPSVPLVTPTAATHPKRLAQSITSAASARTAAALSLMPANRGVLTTEMKINFLAPAAGDLLIACGKVLKAGRTLSLVQAEIFAVTADQERLIAFSEPPSDSTWLENAQRIAPFSTMVISSRIAGSSMVGGTV
jgi:hypothetical protein